MMPDTLGLADSPIRLATRSSPLALWQARYVAELLQVQGFRTELILVQTRGDLVLDRPLNQMGGDGLFTREVQHAVLERRADVTVHSLKDLPTLPAPGLFLAAIPPRGPRGDAWLSIQHPRFDNLPHGAIVATGSLRRRAQMLHRRPDLQVVGLRGNVGTRLSLLDKSSSGTGSESLAGMVLAEAGLERLNQSERIRHIMDTSWMLPAVGQGALGLECRSGDEITQTVLKLLNHEPTRLETLAERCLLAALGGGCLIPVGTLCVCSGSTMSLQAVVLDPDGREKMSDMVSGSPENAMALGELLAVNLIRMGAARLLARNSPSPGSSH